MKLISSMNNYLGDYSLSSPPRTPFCISVTLVMISAVFAIILQGGMVSALSCVCGNQGEEVEATRVSYEKSLESIRATGVDIPICDRGECSAEQYDILKEFGLSPMCIEVIKDDSFFRHCTYYNVEGSDSCADTIDGLSVCHCSDDYCNKPGFEKLKPRSPPAGRPEPAPQSSILPGQAPDGTPDSSGSDDAINPKESLHQNDEKSMEASIETSNAKFESAEMQQNAKTEMPANNAATSAAYHRNVNCHHVAVSASFAISSIISCWLMDSLR